MGTKIRKSCSIRGCPNEAISEGRCADHAKARPSASKRGYGSSWEKLRRAYLRAHPGCEICGGMGGVDVHHRIPISLGGSSTWDNLMTLCHSHHSKVTISQSGLNRNG